MNVIKEFHLKGYAFVCLLQLKNIRMVNNKQKGKLNTCGCILFFIYRGKFTHIVKSNELVQTTIFKIKTFSLCNCSLLLLFRIFFLLLFQGNGREIRWDNISVRVPVTFNVKRKVSNILNYSRHVTTCQLCLVKGLLILKI